MLTLLVFSAPLFPAPEPMPANAVLDGWNRQRDQQSKTRRSGAARV